MTTVKASRNACRSNNDHPAGLYRPLQELPGQKVAACRLRRHAHDGCVENLAARRAGKGSAQGEETAVGGHLPVAVGGRAHDRPVEVLPAHGALEGGITEREQPAFSRHLEVALAAGGGRDPDDGRQLCSDRQRFEGDVHSDQGIAESGATAERVRSDITNVEGNHRPK